MALSPGDPLSSTLAFFSPLVGAIMDGQSKAAGIQQAREGLSFAKNNANRQFRASTATRTDAYGNEQEYDTVLNKWVTRLTPMQDRIVKGGEREQLLSLTDDARQNRNVRNTKYKRGLDAGDDYARQRAEFNYKAPPSEGSIRDELLSLMVGSAQGAARRDTGDATIQALRSGSGLPNPRRSSEDFGSSLPDIMLKAREAAFGESTARNSAHNSKYLPVLQSLQQTMDAGGDAPLRFSDTPKELANQQSESFKNIITALHQGGAAVNTANKPLTEAIYKSGPDTKYQKLAMSMLGIPNVGGKKSGKSSDVPLGSSRSVDDIDDSVWDNLAKQFSF